MAQQKFTDAEMALIEALPVESNGAVVSLVRRQALAAFAAHGLPSRRLENWHYTDLRVLLRHVPARQESSHADCLPPLVAHAQLLGLTNGQALTQSPLPFALPLRPLLDGGEDEALLKWRAGDVISQLNTAYVRDGWKINIGTDHDPNQIIEIQHRVESGQSHILLPIHVADGTRATFILRECGDDGEAFSTAITNMEIGDGAEVTFIIARQVGMAATSLNQFNAMLAKGAKLTLFIVNAGVHLLRQEVNVMLRGAGADFQLRGINLLSGKTHADITMDVRHQCENTSSTEIVRNVVTDQARGVFQGMIRVAQAAQKTDARMACNSLILSDRAEFDAKPELEIFADDVACGHGATVVEINREHLFYLMARGIPKYQARAMLIEAFVAELAEELENESLEQAVKAMISDWLGKRIEQRMAQDAC